MKKQLPLMIIVIAIIALVMYYFFGMKETEKTPDASGGPEKKPNAKDISRMNYSKEEVILMGDQKVSWTNLYAIGAKMDMTKDDVEKIVSQKRSLFQVWAGHNPGWEVDIREIFIGAGVPFTN